MFGTSPPGQMWGGQGPPPSAGPFPQLFGTPPPPPGYPSATSAGAHLAAPPQQPASTSTPWTPPVGRPGQWAGPPAGPAEDVVGSSGHMHPMHRPYDMPSDKPGSHMPWVGGGPVGTGVIPPDVEAQVLHAFAEKEVRRGFVRKVLGIVAVQLAVTVGFAFACFYITPIKTYVQSTPWPFYLSWGLSFGLMLVIACNERLRRHYPANMIFLGLFTVAQAFLVGMITSFFDIEVVALAFLTTCVAVAALALIACQTKVDVTSWGSMLFVPGMVLLALVFIGVFWINKITFLVIAGAAALLTSVYIVYDLQLIMGGKQYALSPDEYVFAAMSLYLDIVQLFIWLLYLIGLGRN